MLRLTSAIFLVALIPLAVRGDADIYLRDGSKFKAIIQEESTQGIKVLGKKDLVPAGQILDVFHEVKPIKTQISLYRPAFQAEKDALDPAKEAARQKYLKEALAKYRDTLKNLEPGQPLIERHLQYKIAWLTLQQVRLGDAKLEYALLDLRDFKNKHANSWQLTECLKLLADVHIQMKNFADAEKTYKELADADVDPQVKQEAEFLSAQISIRAGNHVEALKRLQTLAAKIPRTSPMFGNTQIAITESMLASRQTDAARQMLTGIIKSTPDGSLKARAYNTLGKSYFDAGDLKEARWQFLWVDLMYNQDAAEHARALYHLWQIFASLGEQERALECRELLLNNREFQGTEYQRLARQ